MSGTWPESTGLTGSGATVRRQAWTVWWRQAAGIFRASRRARLRPAVVAGRLAWIFVAQAALAGVAGFALWQFAADGGLERVPAEAGGWVTIAAVLLLLLHALARLAGVSGEVLRDVDEQVLESYEATPLASSAYVAGRLALHLVEQGIGLAALAPSFALAFALRAFDAGDFVALTVALASVSLAFCSWSIGRVLRGHARRARGAALPPSLRPGAGAVVAQALIGAAFAGIAFSALRQGVPGIAPLVVGLSLTPAMPLLGAAFDGLAVELFGRPVGLWLPTSIWLLALMPLAWAQARLRWKPPATDDGRGLRLGFLAAWLAPVLLLAASVRGGGVQSVSVLILVAAAGGLILPAWAGGHELADLGERPAVRRSGLFAARRATAGLWALLVQACALLIAALLLPPGPKGLGASLAFAGAAWAGTAPTLLVIAAAARWLRLKHGASAAFFTLLGLLGAGFLAALPELLSAVDAVPVLGAVARAAGGPVGLLASSSPALVLPEAAQAFLAHPADGTWLELEPPWSLGLPVWAAGTLVQALIGLPLAALLNRAARRLGR